MTPYMKPTQTALFADLPPTMAGLWTAVTMTQNIAAHLAESPAAPSGADVDAGAVAVQCGQASAALSSASTDLLDGGGLPPEPVGGEPRHPDFDLGALTDGCIELAVEVLGNEHEPLSPADIMAITCAVSALCTARATAFADRP